MLQSKHLAGNSGQVERVQGWDVVRLSAVFDAEESRIVDSWEGLPFGPPTRRIPARASIW